MDVIQTSTTNAAKTKEDLMKKLAEKKRELLMRQYAGEASKPPAEDE